MSNETEQPATTEEVQQRVAAAFATLDRIYLLHAPADAEAEAWECGHCNVQWPCMTEALILEGLGLISDETSSSESPSDEHQPSN
jgi:hypothetical protein